jgi:hypothetical protein
MSQTYSKDGLYFFVPLLENLYLQFYTSQLSVSSNASCVLKTKISHR